MSFFGDLIEKAPQAILGGLTGGLTSGISSLASGFINPAPEQQKMSQEDVRMGHTEDTRSFKERSEYSWDKAKDRGLTPQEYYGSSAAGGSSSSGGANVLGNSQDKEQLQQSKIHQESQQRSLDRQTQLQQTKMQTDTQKEVASIQAGTSRANVKTQTQTQRYSAELQNALATKNYQLAKQKLYQVELPKLKAELKISSQQFKKLSNQIATTTPKFMLYMKKLSMGVDNMMVEFLQHSYGVNITDPKSIQAMSLSERKAFISHTAGINSQVFKEASGLGLTTQGITEPWTNKISDFFKPGQKTGNKKPRPNLGLKTRQQHRQSLTY